MKTLLMEVTVVRTTSQEGKVRVPITVDDGFDALEAEKLAHMKAADAIRGNIKVADPIVWEAPSEIALLQYKDVRIVEPEGPPPEALSLLASNLLALVKGEDHHTWDDIEPVKQERITKHIRWLDKHIDILPDEVRKRISKVVDKLKRMKAPDELTW